MMKQFYFLLIVGLLLSGFVLIGPSLKGKDKLLDQILIIARGHITLILLSLFDLSIGLSNMVWVGSGKIAILQNFLPSITLLFAGLDLMYTLFLDEYPHHQPKGKYSFSKLLSFIHHKPLWLGILCFIMAFVHFFAEGIFLL